MQDELLNQVNDLNKTVIEKDEEISKIILTFRNSNCFVFSNKVGNPYKNFKNI